MSQLLRVLYEFIKIGLFSIGGGYAIIPLIQTKVVDEFAWMSQQTFMDIITVSQMTPGPLAVNVSTFVGMQTAGILGAVFATFGCVISGIVISLVLYRFFQKHKQSDYVFQVLNGLKACSLGLIASSAMVILLLSLAGTAEISSISSLDAIACVIFICAFFALRKWKASPILVMVISGVVGGFLYLL